MPCSAARVTRNGVFELPLPVLEGLVLEDTTALDRHARLRHASVVDKDRDVPSERHQRLGLSFNGEVGDVGLDLGGRLRERNELRLALLDAVSG
jgi:hypothetical protein